MEQTKRLHYFDVVKGFGIILVVLGHIEYISDPLRTWISSFHMPLFFIVSGMLMQYKDEVSRPLKSTLAKKARGLIIPYLWFSLLYFVIDLLNIALHKIDLATFIEDCQYNITFYGMSVLWFLPALFVAECGFLVITKKLPGYTSMVVVVGMAVLAYFAEQGLKGYEALYASSLPIMSLILIVKVLLRGIVAMLFVCIAYYSLSLIKPNSSFSVVQLIIGLVLFVVNMLLSQVNGCVDFRNQIFENVFLFLFNAVCGSYSLILICKNLPNLEPIAFFGRNSLVVMATHINTYVLYAAILISWQIDRIVTHAKSYIFLFNIMVFTFLFEAIIILVINRFFPFVLGKKKGR